MARHLITSAIPYINGIKHLGNLVGSQLPADLFARYQRQRGHEVMFICATDEHGTPAELAAKKAGKPVAEYCAEMHATQAQIATDFGLSFDHFGRSSSERNNVLTQHFAGKLDENGWIREVEESQIYSIDDARFLPDRYIEGTCPNCGYDKARGDQCENCTKQLDPTDLINPRSAVSGSTNLEVRSTKHLYLRQRGMRDQLAAWIDSKTDWPILTTSIAKKWLNDGEGLQDRGITRDLDWGIPVKKGDQPWPGMEGKVFYVWFDAPIEYIAGTAECTDARGEPDAAWRRWWRLDEGAEDVTYTQFMGKDNVPFHTLSFPATILGSAEPWKLVDYIKSFNYLTYDRGQCVLDPVIQLIDQKALVAFGAHPFRHIRALHEDMRDRAGIVADRLIHEIQKPLLQRRVGRAVQKDRLGHALDGLAGGKHMIQQQDIALPGHFRQRDIDPLADDIAPADQPAVFGVHQFKAMIRSAQHRHEGRRLRKHALQALEFLTVAPFRQHAFGGLDDDGDDARRLALFVGHGGIVQIHPDLFRIALAIQRQFLIAIGQRAASQSHPHHMIVEIRDLAPALAHVRAQNLRMAMPGENRIGIVVDHHATLSPQHDDGNGGMQQQRGGGFQALRPCLDPAKRGLRPVKVTDQTGNRTVVTQKRKWRGSIAGHTDILCAKDRRNASHPDLPRGQSRPDRKPNFHAANPFRKSLQTADLRAVAA